MVKVTVAYRLAVVVVDNSKNKEQDGGGAGVGRLEGSLWESGGDIQSWLLSLRKGGRGVSEEERRGISAANVCIESVRNDPNVGSVDITNKKMCVLAIYRRHPWTDFRELPSKEVKGSI